jgi:hypothetical protein
VVYATEIRGVLRGDPNRSHINFDILPALAVFSVLELRSEKQLNFDHGELSFLNVEISI